MVGTKEKSSSQQNLKEVATRSSVKPVLKPGVSMPQLKRPLSLSSGGMKHGTPGPARTPGAARVGRTQGATTIRSTTVTRTPGTSRTPTTSTPASTLTPRTRTPLTAKATPVTSKVKTRTPGMPGTKAKADSNKAGLAAEEKVIMDLARRPKDKNFKHVFKGSVLVTTLLEYNKDRFEGRAAACKFAQKLLDAGHVQSVVGSRSFDDSAALYRWGDESVVKEAKKMVATTSSHIPKKRIIEMLDLQQGAGGEDAYHVKDVKGKFTAKKPEEDKKRCMTSSTGSDVQKKISDRRFSDQTAPRTSRTRANSTELDSRLPRAKTRSNSIDSTLDRSPRHTHSPAGSKIRVSTTASGMSRTTAPSPSASSGRSSTPRSPISPSPVNQSTRSVTKPQSPSVTPLPEPITFTVQMDSRPAPTPIRPTSSSQAPPTVITSTGPSHTEVLTPTPIHIHTEVFVPVMTTRFEPPAFHVPTRTIEAPVSTVQQAYERGRQDYGSSPEPHPRSGTMSPASILSEPLHDHRATRSLPVQSPVSPVPDSDAAISTCRYDGIEMPALDIDSIDFQFARPPPSLASTAEELEKSMADLEEQSNCYSDNEKQLLEQMKKMKQEHQSQLKSYEEQINELMAKMNGLKGLAEMLESRQAKEEEEEKKMKAPSPVPELPAPLPPPPPPNCPPMPPPPPASGPAPPAFLQPSKTAIKPRVKMRPLFWNRIILESNSGNEDKTTFWHSATEPNFDVDEFEKLFGRQLEKNNNNPKSLHDAMTPQKNKGKQQAIKLLEDNRSRAVGIKMRSMHCQMEDIRAAVYGLDFNKVDLDSLQGVYEIRGTQEEMEKIIGHVQDHQDEMLDQPEQFLYEISQMPHFTERIECLIFIKRFKETLFNIDERLSLVQQACEEVSTNEPLKSVLESVLAYGNYMNGGTQRGQADGFDLNILPKLKDVKSMDNGMNLLQYIARVHCKDLGEAAGRGVAKCGLPEPGLASQASGVGLPEVEAELKGLHSHLNMHRKKASHVSEECPKETLQPFKEKMDDFFESAEHMLKEQQEKFTDTKGKYYELVLYYVGKQAADQITVEDFFKVWAAFFRDYRNLWKEEQKRIAKEMFDKVDAKRKERLKMAKRRKSIAVSAEEAPNKNLKQRFAQLRRRSEAQAPNFRLLRSTSVSSLDVPIGEGERGASPSFEGGRFHDSRDSLLPSHHRAKSDSDGFSIYQNTPPEYRKSTDGLMHIPVRLGSPSCSDLTDLSPIFAVSDPPPLPATPPPELPSHSTPNSYRRDVPLRPSNDTDPLDSVFERMERRRRRGVVVVDPNQDLSNSIQPPQAAHPLHERIRRRRSRHSAEGSEGDTESTQGYSQTPDTSSYGSTEMINTIGHDAHGENVYQNIDHSRRRLSDMKSRLGTRQPRVSPKDSERKQGRTLPAPPVPPRESASPRDSPTGEYIGSYNVRTASEQRVRETIMEQNDSPTSHPAITSLKNSFPPNNPNLSPLRESRCSSPSSTSSHSSIDLSRPVRMSTNMPRMLERAVSEERDLGTLTEQEYRDALRRSARARASSVNSLR